MMEYSPLVIWVIAICVIVASPGVTPIAITGFDATSNPNLNTTTQLRCTVHGPRDVILNVTADMPGTDISPVETAFEPRNQSLTGVFDVRPKQSATRLICTASWGNVTTERNLTLHSFVQPSLMTAPVVTEAHSTSASVSWDQWDSSSHPGDGPVTQYIVKYKEVGAAAVVHTRHAGPTNSLALDGLRPRRTYQLFVLCIRPGPNGMGTKSPLVIFSTPCPEPTIDNLTATTANLYPLHVMVTWSVMHSAYCDTLHYEVAYTLTELDGCVRIPVGKQVRMRAGNTTTNQLKLKLLDLFSTYSISARAYTETGPGPYSTITFTTPEGVPPRPENVTLQRSSDDFLRFSWQPISCGRRGTTIRRYQVELYDSRQELVHRGRILTKKMSSKIVGLEACSTYWFRVAAVGSERFGQYSELVEGATNAGAAPVVRNFTSHSVDAGASTNLSLTWEAPKYTCNIIDYSVEVFLASSDLCSNITDGALVHELHNITRTTIDVANLLPFTYYTVRVMAHTISGTGEAFETTVRTARTVPTAAPALNRPPMVTHDSATFYWRPLPCGTRGGELLEYFYRLQSVIAKELVTGILPVTANAFTFTNLESCKNYSFQMRVRNSDGWGPHSEPTRIATSATVPFRVRDTSVEYQPMDPTHVLVRWDPPGYTPCPVIGYSVQIVLVDRDMCSAENPETSPATRSTEEHHYRFHGLYPNTRYEVGIAAITAAGRGEYRKLLIQTNGTPPSAPPQQVSLQLHSPTSLAFSWEPPACGSRKGTIDGYAYQLRTLDSEVLTEDEVEHPAVTVDRLQPYGIYLFRVRAFNSNGQGVYSTDVTAKTMQSTPSQPSKATVLGRTNSSITISWRRPMNPNGIILNYTVTFAPIQRPRDKAIVVQGVHPLPTDEYAWSSEESSDVINDDATSDEIENVDDADVVYVRQFMHLQAATEYVFVIVAHTALGPGEETVIVEFTRVTAPLQPPAPILISDVRGDAPVTIRFMEEEARDSIDAFQVTVKRLKEIVRRSNSEGPGRFGSSPEYYIAAEWPSDELPVEFEVGDKKFYGDYYNAPLEEGSTYEIALCSISRSSKDSATTCSTPVSVATKEELAAPPPDTSGSHKGLGFVAALCIFVTVAIVIAMLVVRRRVRSSPSLTRTFSKGLSQSVDSAIDVSVPPPEPMRRRGGAMRVKPKVAPRKFSKYKLASSVPISDLPYHVRQLRANGDEKFKSNYYALPGDQLFPAEIAGRGENRRKNRYVNTHPYDYSRVILQELPDIPFSDYINATYIDGIDKERQYIATQGPSNSTLGDFWRMIWQENVEVIVMLTKLRENEKKKCEQYWPSKNHFYGSISVFLIDERYHTDYTERTLLLKKDGESETRQIQQCHFTSWPDMTLPESPTPLLEFRHHVRSLVTNHDDPIVVHCSAGVGRTGTFIAMDAMIEMAEQESALNPWEFIWNMRLKRTRMVQTLEQFMFIYECLLEELNCGYVGRSTISIDREVLSLRERHPVTGRSYLDEQLLVLDALAVDPSDNDLTGALSEENSEKNRFDDIVPLDKLRPYLMTGSDGGRNNYINAMFVPGYKTQHMFLLTQTPMGNTLNDFWRMVYDYRVSLVVSLDDMRDEDWSVSQYWPMTDDLEADPFVVRTTKATPLGDIYQRQLSLRLNNEDGRERTVNQLEIQDWPIDKSLPSHATFLTLIEMVDQYYREHSDRPIIINCRTGVYRSGLFCAVFSAIAKLKSELKVDVFHVVKNLRKCNKRIVADEVEYLFCLEMLQTYIESSQIYANVTRQK